MNKTLLVLVENKGYLPELEAAGLKLIVAPTQASRAEAIASRGAEVEVVLTRGPLGLYAEEMDAMPNLKLICVIGAGYEMVDLPAAEARGIAVTNGGSANSPSVADHAMALLLSLVRDIPGADASVRRGEWRKLTRPSLTGKRLGILGLGAVGLAIAQRAELGFGMSISYHNRSARPGSAYRYCSSVVELAGSVDFLVIATPGGAGTRHAVGREAIEALGANGFIVNIARGSVIDTDALVDALQHRRIAGAGLDVFEDEPNVPDALKNVDNVVLTPHIAGLSPEAMRDMLKLALDNMGAHFSGEPLLTPIHS